MGTWTKLIQRYKYVNYMSGRTPINVSQHVNYRFIHIPKTGGNSFKAHVQQSKREGCAQNIHLKPARETAAAFDREHCPFSIVRNPFDWLISIWHYNWKTARTTWPDLETFLYEFNSHDKSKQTRWNVFGAAPPRHGAPSPMFSFRHLQTCQTYDPLDTVPGPKHSYASFYIRLEKLREATQMMKMSDKDIPIINTTKHDDYRLYYSTRLIDHVTKHRQQELDILGYDFDGPTDDLSIFKVTKPFLWCGGVS